MMAMLVACVLYATTAQAQYETEASTKLRIAEKAIEQLYVDPVDENKLVEDAIKGMLEKLDPHSSYSDPKETKSMDEALDGGFEGIGVQFNIADDTLLIIQPVTNGPSEKIGILAGDRIISVNDTTIAGVKMSREDIMRRLRGRRGTHVKLGIVRRGIPDVLTFDVERDKIPIYTLDASYLIAPSVGYIRIGSFGANTYEEFVQAMEKLRKQGMRDLILDLQDNGGGYLQAAVQIANEFLQSGDLITYTQGRKLPRQDYYARGGKLFQQGRVMVLINEFSASASEILSGAIQDQDRGTVVGRRSFGKGLVQRPIKFKDGSMIRLTVAHYYTPSGRSIQKPYVKGNKDDYAKDLDNRFKHGEMYSADSIHFPDSLKYQTLRLKKTVYGGGGIMPDYFVPLDTTRYTAFHRMLSAKGIIINANLKYVDKHRKELKKTYKSFSEFQSKFVVPQELIDGVMQEAEKQKVKVKNEEEKAKTLPALKNQLKALIARDLWDMSEYFAIVNEENPIVQKALQLIVR